MRKILLVLLTLFLSGCAHLQMNKPQVLPTPAAINNAPFTYNQAGIQAFAQQVAQKNGLSQKKLMDILSQAQLQPQIINAMNRPFEKLTWARYQKLYVRPSLLTAGSQFWSQNQTSLKTAAKQYGVPAQIILAILGVETVYGKNIGQSRALDALYTLAFEYPRRASFFQNELASFLVLTQKSGFDPLTLKSSYAGALGMPQFMPSSYLQYAVSMTKHYPNLFSNNADAIASIANYLQKMGWQKDQPVAIEAHLDPDVKLTDALQNNTYTLEAFKKQGIHAEEKLPGRLRANLITLQGANGPEYWLVFRNFYMIKKYNSSNLYAMAVYQIAEKFSCTLPAIPRNGINCTDAA